jgi:hypothetical protein
MEFKISQLYQQSEHHIAELLEQITYSIIFFVDKYSGLALLGGERSFQASLQGRLEVN